MRYLQSYQFVFVSPKWMQNFGIAVLCQFVPILGPIVLIGYAFDIIEGMLRDGEENYPDFDANRLMPYFSRGAWPFIIQLIVILPLSLIIFVSVLVFYAIILTSPGGPPWWVFLLFGGLLLVVIFLSLVIMPYVVVPLSLRAGLCRSFKEAFNREFYFDFVRKCWKELFLAELFLFVSSQILGLVGMCMFCIGVNVAAAWIMLARHHLMYQVYLRYLERGGIPPVVKDERVQPGEVAG
jgi:hypothetical protein